MKAKICICKNQFLNRCKCAYDVDKNHHPNNLECPRYEPMGFVLIDIFNDKKGGKDAGTTGGSRKV